jgi:hypothetical protein
MSGSFSAPLSKINSPGIERFLYPPSERASRQTLWKELTCSESGEPGATGVTFIFGIRFYGNDIAGEGLFCKGPFPPNHLPRKP